MNFLKNSEKKRMFLASSAIKYHEKLLASTVLSFRGLKVSMIANRKNRLFHRQKMTCYQVQHLMDLYIGKDSSLTPEKRKAFYVHFHNCQDCNKKYQESKRIVGLVKEAWPYKQENEAFLERINQPDCSKEVIDQCWQRLKCQIPELTEIEKNQKYLPSYRRIGAAVACLLIGASLWMIFSTYPKSSDLAEKFSVSKITSIPKPTVEIGLINQFGNIAIPTGNKILSGHELKTLLINGKHRVTMNINTVIAVEPFIENGNIGCSLKLNSGQIYAHVQQDGNPFVVDTAHGKAVITGTTFDVKTTGVNTTLVVSEGTVQFESEKGTVKVRAGQTSEIVGQSAPSIPLSCNAAVLTAWATAYELEGVLVQDKPTHKTYNITDLALSLALKAIVLEETDYDHWVEQKRDWFEQEFLWIFQLKDALAKEGIEVDYPELLIRSEDVWQFAFLETVPIRFSIFDPNSLLNMVSNYGFSEQWLLQNVPAAKSASEKTVLSKNNFVSLNAFERWLDYLNKTNKLIPPAPTYSYHASKYLAETRSLIWFLVRDGWYDLTDEARTEVLTLLQEEVAAAYQCQNDELYPDDDPKPPCCEDKCQEPINRLVGYIETMKTIEERIMEYEITN